MFVLGRCALQLLQEEKGGVVEVGGVDGGPLRAAPALTHQGLELQGQLPQQALPTLRLTERRHEEERRQGALSDCVEAKEGSK